MSWIHHLAAFCALMPYLGIGTMPTDVQPFALIFASLSLAILVLTREMQAPTLVIPLGLALTFAIFGFFFGTPIMERDFFYDARALYGYLTSVVVFLVAFNYLRRADSNTVCRIIDITMGIIFFGFLLNILGLTWLIQLIVARAEFEFFEDQDRGLTSFFPEQSRLANQMILLITLYYAINRLTPSRAVASILIGALSTSGQFFINFSVFVISLVISAASTVTFSRQAKLRMYISMAIVASLGALFGYLAAYHADTLVGLGFPIRGINAFRDILLLDLRTLGQDLGFLFKISGPLQGVAATSVSPFSLELGANYYFLSNLDFVYVYEELLYWLFEAPLAPYPERAYSVFGAWVTDLKLFGIALSILFTVLFYRKANLASGRGQLFTRAFFLTTMFLFVTRSNTSDPTFWATVAAICVTHEAGRSHFNRSSNQGWRP